MYIHTAQLRDLWTKNSPYSSSSLAVSSSDLYQSREKLSKMDKLSPELLSLIASYVSPTVTVQLRSARERQARGPYTITHGWQHAMESRTFTSIRLKSTEIDTFASTFLNPRRQLLLRQLELTVCLPTHGDTRPDHATNESAFRDAVGKLLTLLEQWEQEGPNSDILPDLALRVQVAWDINPNAPGPVDLDFNVLNSSAARRYLTLGDEFAASLPTVRRVTSFSTSVSMGLAPHPTSMCQLAGLFPRLRTLNLEHWDPAVRRRDMRREHRVALADGLRGLAGRLPRLAELKICRRGGGDDPVNHSFDCQDFSDPEGVDLLCEAIRQLAQSGSLTRLELEDVLISPDLFQNRRPRDEGAPAVDAPWSALRYLEIRGGILSSNGRWLYTGNPDDVEISTGTPRLSDEDESDDSDSDSDLSDDSEDNDERDAAANGARPHHYWRMHPDAEAFDPLVEAMADAMLHRMPALEHGCLDVGSHLPDMVYVAILAEKQGTALRTSDRVGGTREELAVRRLKSMIGRETHWDVPRGVRSMWEEWVGEDGHVFEG